MNRAGRRHRTGSIAVVVVGVLALAACSSAVSGHGAAAPAPSHSPSPRPSTSSAPATSAPTKPTSAVRVPARTRLGDLETADFCAGIDLVGFEHLGEPAFHLYQVAGGCFIDVYTSSSNLMLVDIIGYQDIDEPGSADQPADLLDGADTTKNLGDGYSEATWQDDGTACRRAFGVAGSGSLAGAAVEVTEEQLRGKSTTTQRCAAANEALLQISHLYRHVLPRRSLASPSVTRYDLCTAITIGSSSVLTTFGAPQPQASTAACQISDGNYYLSVRPAFVSTESPPDHSHIVTVSGHRLDEEGDSKGCEITSSQGKTPHGGYIEILDMVVTSDSSTYAEMCAQGVTVLVDILHSTGLH